MAAAEVSSQQPEKRTWGEFKAKKSEAMPKNTLFGSNIEVLDGKEKQAARELDVKGFQDQIDKERKVKQDKYKVSIPSHLQDQISDKPLQHTKEELEKQLKQTQRARKLMDLLEEKSKYFSVETIPVQTLDSASAHSTQWMSEKDIENARDINILGLAGTTSYNRDKYQHRSPIHGYSQQCYPAKHGMDIYQKPFASAERPPYYRVVHKGPPNQLSRDMFMKPPQIEDVNDPCVVTLPPNIKHQFGTQVCNRVLGDTLKVEETMTKQKQLERPFQKSSRGQSGKRQKHLLEETIDPAYESLGNALRTDLFPGHTFNHKKSQATSVYTDSVHKQRVPDPDKYRYQRDELSTWAEQNVLRERVKKAWDAYQAGSQTNKSG